MILPPGSVLPSLFAAGHALSPVPVLLSCASIHSLPPPDHRHALQATGAGARYARSHRRAARRAGGGQSGRRRAAALLRRRPGAARAQAKGKGGSGNTGREGLALAFCRSETALPSWWLRDVVRQQGSFYLPGSVRSCSTVPVLYLY